MDQPGLKPRVLLADMGYDAYFILADLEASDIAAVIPAKRNRKIPACNRRLRLRSQKPRRALLLEAEALPQTGHSIRQDRRQLPRLCPRRFNPTLDQTLCAHRLDGTGWR